MNDMLHKAGHKPPSEAGSSPLSPLLISGPCYRTRIHLIPLHAYPHDEELMYVRAGDCQSFSKMKTAEENPDSTSCGNVKMHF